MNIRRFPVTNIRQSSDGKKTVVVINDDSIDTYGTLIDPRGADLSQYQRNPVFLINHDYNRVAGNGALVRLQDNKLIAEVPDEAWDSEDEDAMKWMRKVKSGKVKMASIGAMWDDKDVEERQTEDGKTYFHVLRWSLVEFSWVAVGANYNAIVEQRDLGIDELKQIRAALTRVEQTLAELSTREPQAIEVTEPDKPEQPSAATPALPDGDTLQRMITNAINKIEGRA